MTELFGTDDIRGIADQDLTAELALNVSKAAGLVLGKNQGHCLIGTDTRESANILGTALATGLMSMGMDVTLVGIIPTPEVAYLTRTLNHTCGVVISASRNPCNYNEIKFFSQDGYKLPDQVEEELEGYLLKRKESPENTENFGRLTLDPSLAKQCTRHLQSLCPRKLSGLKIVLDCGNEALSKIAPYALTSLGANVFTLNTNPNERDINLDCGSTNPKVIQSLVPSKEADLGFSFDGDADRIIVIDSKGRIVDGDHILAICAHHLHQKDQLNGDIVGTVIPNLGLKKYLRSVDVDFIEAKVGDRYVLEGMRENDCILGGEQSGHITFTDYNTTGDDLAIGLHLIEVMLESQKSLADLNNLMTSYPQVLVNTRVLGHKKKSYLRDDILEKSIEALERKYEGNGRILIRPSGTEPLTRVMIEETNLDEMRKDAQVLAGLIQEQLGDE